MGDRQPRSSLSDRGLVVGALRPGEPLLEVGHLDELVNRRIEETDRRRDAAHRLQDLDEVAALEVAQALERLIEARGGGTGRGPVLRLALSSGQLARDEHLPNQLLAVRAKEHVLGPAKADPLGSQLSSTRRVGAGVGVGPHAKPSQLVSPRQDLLQGGADLRRDERHVVGGYHAG